MSQVSPLDRLLAEEPFVRTLAQALLAEEADEVVQQTWLRAMKHGGAGVSQPRSWLASIVRNVAYNLLRDRRRREARERAAAAEDLAPSSSELMEREEQRKRLVGAIDALPSQLRTVLLLRYYEGLAPRHIAAKTGLSNDTVRNRIRRALQLLRERLDSESGGDRRAWMLAMIPIACPTPAQAAPAVAALPLAGVAGLLALLAGIAAVALATWALWPPPAELPMPTETARTAPGAAAAQADQATPAEASASLPVEEDPPRPTDLSRTADLEVHVVHSDGAPARGVRVFVHDGGGDQRVPRAQATSNDAGVVRFASLPRREIWISSDRGTQPLVTEVGPQTVQVYRLEQGVRVVGVVTDEQGQPVPFATVEGAPLALATLDVQPLCRTDASGRFELRDVHTKSVLGARAAGRLPGVLHAVRGRPGATTDVRLTIGGTAADVRGVVRDGRGRPVPDAVVRVGGGRTSGLHMDGNVHPPMPALAKSDAAGAFAARGVPIGRLPVAVVARGFAPWFGEVDATDAAPTVDVELQPGAAVHGRVEMPDGSPAGGAEVEFGELHAFDYQRTHADADGRFVLERLPPGAVELRAHLREVGGTRRTLQVAANAPTRCRLRLDGRPQLHPGGPGPHDHAQPPPRSQPPRVPQGPVGPRRGSCAISGYVLGPDGNPLAGAQVVAVRRGGPGRNRIERLSEDDGAFDLDPLPPGVWRVDVFAAGLPPISTDRFPLREGEAIDIGDVDVPRGGRLRIHLPSRIAANARVVVLPSATERPLPVHHVHGARETDYLPAGTYEVVVFERRRELLRANARVVVDRVVDVTLR